MRCGTIIKTFFGHVLTMGYLSGCFYSDLTNTTRTLLDASAGGAMMSKSEDEAYKLLENMALNNCQWLSERVTPKKLVGMYDVDVFFNLAAQVSLLTKKIKVTQLQNA